MLMSLGNALGFRREQHDALVAPASQQLLEHYFHVAVHQGLLDRSLLLKAKPTHSLINPYPKLPFDSSARELTSKLGKPSLRLLPQHALTEELLFYRKRVSGIQVRFEFHFHRGGLFYAKRVYRQTTDEEYHFIIDNIRKKYLSETDFDPESDKIIDVQGNELMISRNKHLSIDYLYAQGPAFGKIRDWIDEKTIRLPLPPLLGSLSFPGCSLQ